MARTQQEKDRGIRNKHTEMFATANGHNNQVSTRIMTPEEREEFERKYPRVEHKSRKNY